MRAKDGTFFKGGERMRYWGIFDKKGKLISDYGSALVYSKKPLALSIRMEEVKETIEEIEITKKEKGK